MRGRVPSLASVSRGALVAMVVMGPAAEAQQAPPAKRLCKQRLAWTGKGETRVEAQRRAVGGWSAAATGQHGEAFARWANGGIARVSCSLTTDGHACRAAASPCRDLAEAGAGQSGARK